MFRQLLIPKFPKQKNCSPQKHQMTTIKLKKTKNQRKLIILGFAEKTKDVTATTYCVEMIS